MTEKRQARRAYLGRHKSAVVNFFGYDLAVAGEDFTAPPRGGWDAPGGIRVITDEPAALVAARLRPFGLDSIVTNIAGVEAARRSDEDGYREQAERAGIEPMATFSPFYLRPMLTEEVVRRDLPDTAARGITLSDLRSAERAFQAVSPPVNAEAGWPVALRMIQAQYHNQLAYSYFARELRLLLAFWLPSRLTLKACFARAPDLVTVNFADTPCWCIRHC